MGHEEQNIEEMSFEVALSELERVVEQMEAEELTLEQMLALYERGGRLTQRCNMLLDQAELRIEQLASARAEA